MTNSQIVHETVSDGYRRETVTKYRIFRAAAAVLLALGPAAAQTPGRSEPSFSQPSRAPGVDYVLPTEGEVKATLDRIRDYFVRSTPYRIVDTATGAVVRSEERRVGKE